MKLEQVAVQLYTVREFLQTPEQAARSLSKLKAIGYGAVQIGAAGLAGLDEAATVRLLAESGLTLCSTHEPGDLILDAPQVVAERLNHLGCRYTAYPMPAGLPLETRQDIERLAVRLENSGRTLAEAGITLAYHNHALEFRRYEGRTMLEIIYEQTDPRYLQAEPDTYWVQYGGGSPAEWCRRLKGRLPLLHLKDYTITAEHTPTYAEIGAGNLDFPAIIHAADAAGCQWYIVEQDTCPGDPFDSLARSFKFIRDRLCE